MKYAVKNKKSLIHAYRLGDDTPMERQLAAEGVIRRLPDGETYELFSKEAVHGSGEKARKGDYFKVDTAGEKHYAYPNEREFFESRHTLLDAGTFLYEQKPQPLPVWQADDPVTPEIEALLRTGRLRIDPSDPEHYFQAHLWGTLLSTDRAGTVVFYSVQRTAGGAVADVDFNLVSAADFAAGYTLCSADGKPLAVS